MLHPLIFWDICELLAAESSTLLHPSWLIYPIFRWLVFLVPCQKNWGLLRNCAQN